MTLLADVVAASHDVGATSSRSGKIAILAELLSRLDPGEVSIAVGFLSGVSRQGRVGVGYSTVYGVEPAPADAASLTVGELDRAITEIQAATGTGSAARRKRILGDLLGRATEQEADFVRRLFTGELRQGALAGVGSSGRSSRCSPPPPRAWPRRLRASSAPRWSGGSTGSASGSIAAATRSASTRATSTTSRTRCPGSSTLCAAFA